MPEHYCSRGGKNKERLETFMWLYKSSLCWCDYPVNVCDHHLMGLLFFSLSRIYLFLLLGRIIFLNSSLTHLKHLSFQPLSPVPTLPAALFLSQSGPNLSRQLGRGSTTSLHIFFPIYSNRFQFVLKLVQHVHASVPFFFFFCQQEFLSSVSTYQNSTSSSNSTLNGIFSPHNFL